MALLQEIVGTIVASAAFALAIYVFIRTLDYQSYKDADSDYRDVLKIGIEYLCFYQVDTGMNLMQQSNRLVKMSLMRFKSR